MIIFFVVWLLTHSLCCGIGPGFSRLNHDVPHGKSPQNSEQNPIFPYTSEENSYAYWNCHTIPPNMTLCKSVGYSRMVLPNFLQHESLREVIQQANVWVALVNTDCHPDIQRFLCSLYAPVCLKSHQESKIPPCWELCEQVKNSCLPRMRLFGFDWPEIVQCHQFPKLAESMCIPPQESTVVKCAPCEQMMTLENIASSYCMADVVLKAAIKDVLPSRDRTSLLIHLSSKTRALKLTKRDGTISTNTDVQRLWKRSRLRRHEQRALKLRSQPRNTKTNAKLPDGMGEAKGQPTHPENGFWIRRERRSIQGSQSNKTFNMHVGTRRDKRIRRNLNTSIYDLDGITELQLSCSTCSGLTSFFSSPRYSNLEQKRWLIMGRRILSGPAKYYSNNVQVTFLVVWDRDSPEFKHALNAIRTQPVSKLCPQKSNSQLHPTRTGTANHNLKILRSVPSELSDVPSTRRQKQVRMNQQSSVLSVQSALADKKNIGSQEQAPSSQMTGALAQETGVREYNGPIKETQSTYADEIHAESRHAGIPVNSRLPTNRQLTRHPIYENMIKTWGQHRWTQNYRQQTPWTHPRQINEQERRRQRRRERRQWKRKQKDPEMQSQQRRKQNTFLPVDRERTALRQTPINPYSNEDSRDYPNSFWFP